MGDVAIKKGIKVKKIEVSLQSGANVSIVGHILAAQDGKIYFEYTSEFLKTGLEISPITLPLLKTQLA